MAGLLDILKRVERRLERVERARQDLLLTRDRKQEALEDLVIHARALTNVIQTCRHKLPKFENWYAPHADTMRKDPAMRRFYEMRSEVLKEGHVAAKKAAILFSSEPWFPAPPKNAVAFIPWDEDTGDAAWLVRRDDGSEEVQHIPRQPYVDVSEFLVFEPSLGDYREPRVEDSAERYVGYLRGMVDELRVLILRAI